MAKNIVICCDGTGQDGLKKTNVVRLFIVLDLKNPDNQIACYDPGVGTMPVIVDHHPSRVPVKARAKGL